MQWPQQQQQRRLMHEAEGPLCAGSGGKNERGTAVAVGKAREGISWRAGVGGEMEEIARAVPNAYWQTSFPEFRKHFARRWLTGGLAPLEGMEGKSEDGCLRRSLRHRLGGDARTR